ncbi:hypothetical protein CWI37_0537p0010 [Hamiltosporidium tvaerminnensis]|uniref:Uncharacterized protein n=1 Tax=Hamiltosporidium tvaerminnensis TaxID=1176355 RepID=A0A4V2JV13_9MICR|nr:hypothetical protein CWI37_0537p0010 [Hamiltosporidium tvaerminnensis]
MNLIYVEEKFLFMGSSKELVNFDHLYDLIMDAQNNYEPLNRSILFLTKNWSDVLQFRQIKYTNFYYYRHSIEVIKNQIISQSDIIMNENILSLENEQTKNWIVLLFSILIRIFRIIQIKNDDSFDIENKFLSIAFGEKYLAYCSDLQKILIPIASLKEIRFVTENQIKFVFTFDGNGTVILYDKITDKININSDKGRLLLTNRENFELLVKNRCLYIDMNNALSMRLLALKILFLRENNLANKNRISHKEIFKLLSKHKESPGFKLIHMSSVIIYSTCFSQKEKNFRNILSILNEYAHRINDIENIHIYFFIEDITYFISLIQRDSSYEMNICNKHITDLHDDLFAISCYHITYLLDSIRFYKTYEIHPDYDLSNHIEALSLCFNIFTINNIHLSNFTEVSRLNNKFIDIVSVKALIGKWEDNICIILFEFQEKMYPEIANEIIFQKYFDIYNYFINRKYFDSSLISTIFLIISNIIHHKSCDLQIFAKKKKNIVHISTILRLDVIRINIMAC